MMPPRTPGRPKAPVLAAANLLRATVGLGEGADEVRRAIAGVLASRGLVAARLEPIKDRSPGWWQLAFDKAEACRAADWALFAAGADGLVKSYDEASGRHLLTFHLTPPRGRRGKA